VTREGAVDRQAGNYKEGLNHFADGYSLEKAYDAVYAQLKRFVAGK
jgi:hypothetical protein